MTLDLTDDKSTLVQAIAWCRQVGGRGMGLGLGLGVEWGDGGWGLGVGGSATTSQYHGCRGPGFLRRPVIKTPVELTRPPEYTFCQTAMHGSVVTEWLCIARMYYSHYYFNVITQSLKKFRSARRFPLNQYLSWNPHSSFKPVSFFIEFDGNFDINVFFLNFSTCSLF